MVAFATAAALACGVAAGADADDPVLARVGDVQIRTSQVRKALEGVPAFELAALGSTNVEILRRYLDEALVREEILAEAARRRGALDDRALQVQQRKILAGALVRRELDKLGKADDISAEDVQKYYDAHAAEYRNPERVRLAHIVVATKPEADAVLAKALADKTREGWSSLVLASSLDPSTRRSDGDLGFVSADGRTTQPKVIVPIELVNAAFQLKDGDIAAAPVQTSAGFHIVYRRGHVEGTVRTVSDEAPTIRELLFEQRQKQAYETMLEGLRAATPIELDEDLLPVVTIAEPPRGIPKQP